MADPARQRAEDAVSDRPVDALATERRGAGERIVAIHGFTQNRRCWGPVADDLARDHEVVLVDAPGHGDSATIQVSFEDGAALIATTAGAGTYLGYSMGGRYALRAALDHAATVERLILVGASPGIDGGPEREQRRRADQILADHLEQIGVPAFLDEWLAQPLFASLTPPARFVRERLGNDAAGLAASLRLAGTGEQEPVWDRLGELSMPVLVVAGAMDAKFTAIGEQMVEAIGANARLTVIPGAGHTAHLEQPDAFLTAVRAWLRANPLAPGAR